MLAAILSLLAAVCFGAGEALQRTSLHDMREEVTLRKFFRTPHRVFGRFFGDPRWVRGFFIGTTGSLSFLAAVKLGDLVIVQPIVCLQIVVAALAGTLFLGEALQLLERSGVALILVGAVFLGLSAGKASGTIHAGGVEWLAVAGTLLGLGGLAALARGGLPEELTLALSAGLTLGLAVVHRKTWMDLLFSADASVAAKIFSPALAVAFAATFVGVAYAQTALARGRVSVFAPTATLGGLLVPVLTGWLAWGESFGPARALALALVLVGGLCFVLAGWKAIPPAPPA